MGRSSAFRRRIQRKDSPITWEFESETGQLDGTFAHAIERIFMLAAHDAGFRTAEAGILLGLPASQRPFAYAAADDLGKSQ